MKIFNFALMLVFIIVLSGCSGIEGYKRSGWVSFSDAGNGSIMDWPTNEDIYNELKDAPVYSSFDDCSKAANEYLMGKNKYATFMCNNNCHIEKSMGFVEEGSPLFIKCDEEKKYGYQQESTTASVVIKDSK